MVRYDGEVDWFCRNGRCSWFWLGSLFITVDPSAHLVVRYRSKHPVYFVRRINRIVDRVAATKLIRIKRCVSNLSRKYLVLKCMYMCLCVSVYVCVCVRACLWVCVSSKPTHRHICMHTYIVSPECIHTLTADSLVGVSYTSGLSERIMAVRLNSAQNATEVLKTRL